MDLQVAAVNPVVVGDDHRGQLDVLVADRLQGSVKLLHDKIQPAQDLLLEAFELFAKLVAGLLHQPNFPVT